MIYALFIRLKQFLSKLVKDNYRNINMKKHHNYVAFFLTSACNLRCSYCINDHDIGPRRNFSKSKHMPVDRWIKAANRLILREDLPLTLQGGEPLLYKGFYKFVNEVKNEIKMDLLTNMMFDVDEFIQNVPVERFTRKAPYASIRASYHPGENDISGLIEKTIQMQEAGFKIGIYGILNPDSEIRADVLTAREKCLKNGLDFRTKEFLGSYNGSTYGTFKDNESVSNKIMKSCECKTTELIVGPGGDVYRCHADLYQGRLPIAHILDDDLTEAELDRFRACNFYGSCNPCDVKVKTNRFQVFGHSSVEIRNVQNLKNNQTQSSIREEKETLKIK